MVVIKVIRIGIIWDRRWMGGFKGQVFAGS